MPRLSPALIRQAASQNPLLPLLLRVCRDLPSARNELRWLQEHARDTVAAKSYSTHGSATSEGKFLTLEEALAGSAQKRKHGKRRETADITTATPEASNDGVPSHKDTQQDLSQKHSIPVPRL